MSSIKNRVNMRPAPQSHGQRAAARLEKAIQTAEYAVRIYTETGAQQDRAEWQGKLDAARKAYAELHEAAV